MVMNSFISDCEKFNMGVYPGNFVIKSIVNETWPSILSGHGRPNIPLLQVDIEE